MTDDDVYTPTLAIVREDYIRFQDYVAGTPRMEAGAEFDRWFVAEMSRTVQATIATANEVNDVDD